MSKAYDVATMSIHLQGIGRVSAKFARDLVVGDRMVWNFGSTSRVLSITPSASGKTITVEHVSEESGRTFTRKFKTDRLVAFS